MVDVLAGFDELSDSLKHSFVLKGEQSLAYVLANESLDVSANCLLLELLYLV